MPSYIVETSMNQRPEPAHKPANVVDRTESNNKIKELLFSQKERPKNLHEVKIVNVFDDRYRINVWVRHSDNGIEGTKIHSSYFARFDGDSLDIRA